MASTTKRWLAILTLIGLAAVCGYHGGRDSALDGALVREGVAWRAASGWPTTIGIVLNYVGGAPATVGLALGAAFWLWSRDRSRDGLALAGILIGGRLTVEVLKQIVHRARPAFDAHPVETHSLSFPSAHAANSMIAFCGLALVFAPRRHRVPILFAALAASLAVGASRPLLGVHWPSDVVGGWAVGAAWLLLWWPVMQRLFPDETQHDVVGGHRPAAIED